MSTDYKGGYMGLVMEYDLTTGTAKEYPWTDKERALYLGGKAMASRIMYDCFTGKEDPYGEENLLIISTGPLTGTGAPSSSRFNISTLSPLTGITTSSNCGGRFGYYLKKAGLDALILRGKCSEHSWLEINNGKFILHNADEDGLWGLKTGESQEKLQELMMGLRNGKKTKFAQLTIGPAGENLVRYACVISDERAAGRGGVGAVFGSKNLKAITVNGNKMVAVADPVATKEWNKKWFRYLKNHPLTGNQLPRLGTAGLVSQMQMRGMLSTKNYQFGRYEHFEEVNGETLAEEFNIVNKGCLTCPIKCARTVKVENREVKGPELETLGLLGGGILNSDMYSILKWNNEIDELGMDTISASSTLAWAMEANEKGLWNNGLSFGNTEGISQVWDDIAHRRGIGDELAEGSMRLAEKYGGMEFAIQSKGMELAAYEPRRAVGQGLGYAVSNRGGCHLNGGYLVIVEGLGLFADPQTPHAKADFTMLFQDLMETISASGQCLFTSYAFFPGFLITRPNSFVTKMINKAVPAIGGVLRLINRTSPALGIHLPVFHHTKLFKKALGMPMTFGKYIRIGERSYSLERAVNAKFGVSSKRDTLPKRLTDTPQDPKNPKTKVPLERMKKTYYKARGWDQNGIPTEKTLKKLGII
ncbi:MAG: aldehyde ferredoxin oxidoreductase family protein [Lachnospiraceae bacterium]|nr:aldehyde ferredoxin oxidoreductase family protein [Lachnospiraceae bacterium]